MFQRLEVQVEGVVLFILRFLKAFCVDFFFFCVEKTFLSMLGVVCLCFDLDISFIFFALNLLCVSFHFLYFSLLKRFRGTLLLCWRKLWLTESLNLGLGLGFNPNPNTGLRGWSGVRTRVEVGVEPQPQLQGPELGLGLAPTTTRGWGWVQPNPNLRLGLG